jgi:hypothetical protein
MKLAPIEIDRYWDDIMYVINNSFQSPRKEKLLEFYSKYKQRIKSMPASSKIHYHSCFEGGYVFHVMNVITAGAKLNKVWQEMGVNLTYSDEELVFSLLNHDIGKMGDENYPYYVPNPSAWHVKNQGAVYTINQDLSPMPVPDRSIYLLQRHGIEMSYNEMIAIKTHDGLYSEGNKEYLMDYTKPFSSLLYIVHQADIIASRIEYEKQVMYAPKIQEVVVESKKRLTKKEIQTKLLSEKEGMDAVANLIKNL